MSNYYVYIYLLEDIIPLYVGKGIGDRLNQHKKGNGNKDLYDAIQHNPEHIACKKIAINLCERDAELIEAAMIAIHQPMYNIQVTDHDRHFISYDGKTFRNNAERQLTQKTKASQGRAKAKADGKHLGRHADTDLHANIQRLHEQGVPKARIAKELGCSRGTVYNALKK